MPLIVRDTPTLDVPLEFPGEGDLVLVMRRVPEFQLTDLQLVVQRLQDADEDGQNAQLEQWVQTRDWVMGLVEGWRGAEDANGQPVPFSIELLAKVIDSETMAAQLMLAYWRTHRETRAGNSAAPRSA